MDVRKSQQFASGFFPEKLISSDSLINLRLPKIKLADIAIIDIQQLFSSYFTNLFDFIDSNAFESFFQIKKFQKFASIL